MTTATTGSDAVVGVASSVTSSQTSKLLRIVAFGPALLPAFEYTVRIYVVMDISDALQACSDNDDDDDTIFRLCCLHFPQNFIVYLYISAGRLLHFCLDFSECILANMLFNIISLFTFKSFNP